MPIPQELQNFYTKSKHLFGKVFLTYFDIDLEDIMDTQLHNDFSVQVVTPPVINQWPELLSRLDPIDLTDMDAVALLNRTDTKYVLTARQLYQALATLSAQYWVLDVDGVRLNHYRTLYFDTADFNLYMRHHAGGRNRYKVRSREYVDTSLSFLEVKHNVDERTIKNRLQTPAFVTRFTPKTSHFVSAYTPLDPRRLEPKLINGFSRITLVSKYHKERLTLDLNLHFFNDTNHVVLPDIAIAEVKQEGINRHSDFVKAMRQMHIRPTGFSKYCIGVSMLYPHIKHNNFKPNLRLINKLMVGLSF